MAALAHQKYADIAGYYKTQNSTYCSLNYILLAAGTKKKTYDDDDFFLQITKP